MKKDTKSTQKADDLEIIYYNPDSRMVEWFRKRLILEQEKKRHRNNGSKPSNKFHKEMKESAARKVEILDKVVFPAMTDLMYFFEALEVSSDLKQLFEKDVKKLLDARFTNKMSDLASDARFQSFYRFRNNNLYRLLSNILSLDFGETGIEIDTKNFRIGLLYQLQCLILDSMDGILEEEYGFFSQVSKSAMKDYRSAVGWLAFIAKSISDDSIDYDRKIGFVPITYSTRGSLPTLKL